MSAATALAKGRRLAESLMVDACRITTTTPGDWDDATGTYLPGITTTVYDGKCRIRNANPAPQNAAAGETVWAADLIVLSLPVAASVGVKDGHEVEVLSSANDPAAVGLRLTIQAGHVQTYSTARRFSCQVVTRDD